ncbi:ABC transporter substrate-binding protein [Paenibacillus piri]|uniref:Sugar ABC transporter substrate-binding protein n=1 Tax=Paenibacillus piri TaxID=2547395 RepID=A0A4V2ZUA1_9BACL|nr:sugar ABC transporter substrate-binding protein [Paenibacillus piri]TDG00185.1 sugar ABC transporter substrate-binding protein [Paenibacillus piri]
MKTFKKGMIACAASALLLTTACGGGASGQAGGKEAGKTAKPFEGKKITVFVQSHPWTDTIKGALPEFEAATGMKVDIQGFSDTQLQQKLAVQFTSASESPDVFMFRPYMDKILYAKNGWTTPLDDYVKKDPNYDFNDFVKSAVDENMANNKLMGIPIFSDQFVMYYRKDILEKKGISVPKTLDELKEAAKKVHDPANDLNGFVARGERNALVVGVSSYLFAEGGDFMKGDFTTGATAAVNTPEAISGFQIYADLLKNYAPQGVLNMAWPQAAGIFAQGKAAFYTEVASVYQNVTDPKKSLISDKVGFAMFPAGKNGMKPFNVAAWSLGINSKTPNKDASWAFIQWATNKENVLKVQRNGVPGTRSSVWEKKEGTETYPQDLAATIKETMKIGIGHNVPQLISVGEARDTVGSIVVKAVLGEDIKAAADKANAELQAIIDKDKTK